MIAGYRAKAVFFFFLFFLFLFFLFFFFFLFLNARPCQWQDSRRRHVVEGRGLRGEGRGSRVER